MRREIIATLSTRNASVSVGCRCGGFCGHRALAPIYPKNLAIFGDPVTRASLCSTLAMFQGIKIEWGPRKHLCFWGETRMSPIFMGFLLYKSLRECPKNLAIFGDPVTRAPHYACCPNPRRSEVYFSRRMSLKNMGFYCIGRFACIGCSRCFKV